MANLLSPAHCVCNNLHQTTRVVSRIYAEEMRPCGIKRSQFSILAYLQSLGVIQLTELADLMIMDRTTLSRNLKPLERKGLVFVKKSPNDARARELRLSKEGKAKFREALKYWTRAQKKLLKLFGKKNWQDLESTLHRLRKQVS